MQELLPQNKKVFWGGVILLLALTLIPSLALIETAGQYIRFLLQWNPGTITATHINRIPHRDGFSAKMPEPQIRFVKFTLDSPRASKVLVVGDFDNWQAEAMSRSSDKKGRWEILLPLPPGRYQYSFQVDGTWTPDPDSRESGQKGDLRTSIRQVR